MNDVNIQLTNIQLSINVFLLNSLDKVHFIMSIVPKSLTKLYGISHKKDWVKIGRFIYKAILSFFEQSIWTQIPAICSCQVSRYSFKESVWITYYEQVKVLRALKLLASYLLLYRFSSLASTCVIDH